MPQTIAKAVAPTKEHQINPSPFANIVSFPTSDEIAAQLSIHLRQLHSRRHCLSSFTSQGQQFACSRALTLTDQDFGGVGSDVMMSSSSTNVSDGTSTVSDDSTPRRKDVPMFTLKQVGLVCERMMKERQEELQQEYEKLLTAKLSEQYEAFLKFNQDQLQRRYGETAASYVS